VSVVMAWEGGRGGILVRAVSAAAGASIAPGASHAHFERDP
jgi:hypothetical protein